MDLMISVDQAVRDNQWWKDIFLLYAKKGEYFEIHCWSDETEELSLAGQFGTAACYSMPDIRIIHGTLTDKMIRFLLRVEKPKDSGCYNKMVPFFTLRIGSHYSSEKYGTEILITTDTLSDEDKIERIISDIADHAKLFRNE